MLETTQKHDYNCLTRLYFSANLDEILNLQIIKASIKTTICGMKHYFATLKQYKNKSVPAKLYSTINK